ncbi:MAG: hypothetical protein KDH96_09040, partial [Candidatus Riesia sp.]|nr:hypothetical protein [Candidatus Riesia sp.]
HNTNIKIDMSKATQCENIVSDTHIMLRTTIFPDNSYISIILSVFPDVNVYIASNIVPNSLCESTITHVFTSENGVIPVPLYAGQQIPDDIHDDVMEKTMVGPQGRYVRKNLMYIQDQFGQPILDERYAVNEAITTSALKKVAETQSNYNLSGYKTNMIEVTLMDDVLHVIYYAINVDELNARKKTLNVSVVFKIPSIEKVMSDIFILEHKESIKNKLFGTKKIGLMFISSSIYKDHFMKCLKITDLSNISSLTPTMDVTEYLLDRFFETKLHMNDKRNIDFKTRNFKIVDSENALNSCMKMSQKTELHKKNEWDIKVSNNLDNFVFINSPYYYNMEIKLSKEIINNDTNINRYRIITGPSLIQQMILSIINNNYMRFDIENNPMPEHPMKYHQGLHCQIHQYLLSQYNLVNQQMNTNINNFVSISNNNNPNISNIVHANDFEITDFAKSNIMPTASEDVTNGPLSFWTRGKIIFKSPNHPSNMMTEAECSRNNVPFNTMWNVDVKSYELKFWHDFYKYSRHGENPYMYSVPDISIVKIKKMPDFSNIENNWTLTLNDIKECYGVGFVIGDNKTKLYKNRETKRDPRTNTEFFVNDIASDISINMVYGLYIEFSSIISTPNSRTAMEYEYFNVKGDSSYYILNMIRIVSLRSGNTFIDAKKVPFDVNANANLKDYARYKNTGMMSKSGNDIILLIKREINNNVGISGNTIITNYIKIPDFFDSKSNSSKMIDGFKNLYFALTPEIKINYNYNIPEMSQFDYVNSYIGGISLRNDSVENGEYFKIQFKNTYITAFSILCDDESKEDKNEIFNYTMDKSPMRNRYTVSNCKDGM